MDYLPNERILFESKDNDLILTTHRIRYQYESLGNAEIKSIMLEELCSCSLSRSNQIILLFIAALCIILGTVLVSFFSITGWALLIGILLSLLLIISYFLSRQQILSFDSAGESIKIDTEGMNLETAKMLIDKTESAKNERYQQYSLNKDI